MNHDLETVSRTIFLYTGDYDDQSVLGLGMEKSKTQDEGVDNVSTIIRQDADIIRSSPNADLTNETEEIVNAQTNGLLAHARVYG